MARPKRLDAEKLESLRGILLRGALQAGFPTDLWTIACVRAVVKREFGVSCGRNGGWELVRSLGFTPQKPGRRALQRNPEAITEPKRKTWLALKKSATSENRTIIFIDESGLSEKCPVTRASAPRGQTPVIQQRFTWKQMSAIARLS